MKKRIFSRVLALFMALSMLTTTVFAASFEDLQEAIDGTNQVEVTEDTKPVEAEQVPQAEPTTPDTPEETPAPADDTQDETEPPAAPERTPDSDDTHKNGALVRTDEDGTNYFGYGWSSAVDENQNKTWYYAIEAHDEQGNRFVVLLDDVSKGNGTASGVVIKADSGKTDKLVDIDMNGHSMTGSEDATVIKVEAGANLDLSNGTITGGQIGIDVLGTLILDSVTVTNNGTGVKINDSGKVTFNGDDNKADVELTVSGKTYKVDADTAEALMKEPVATGTDWLLVKGKDDSYIVAYTGSGETLTSNIVKNILTDAANKDGNQRTITGFAIPEGVTEIGYRLFWSIDSSLKANLETINIPESVTKIGEYAFKDCSKLESIIIPRSVTSMGGSPFAGCSSLKRVEILGSVEIPNYCFNGRSSLQYVKISDLVTGIGYEAFKNCTALTEIEWPERGNLKKIAQNAFSGCTSLKGDLVIPTGVEEIGRTAFEKCSGIKKVVIPDTVTKVEGNAFHNSGIKSIWVYPDENHVEVENVIASAFKGYNVFAVSEDVKLYHNGNIVTFAGVGGENITVNDDGEVTVPCGSSMTIFNSSTNTTIALAESNTSAIVSADGTLTISDLEDIAVTVTDNAGSKANWTVTGGMCVSNIGKKETTILGNSTITASNGTTITSFSSAIIGKDGMITTKGENITITEENGNTLVISPGDWMTIDSNGTATIPWGGHVEDANGVTSYPRGNATIKDGRIVSKGPVTFENNSGDKISIEPAEVEDGEELNPVTVDTATGTIIVPNGGSVTINDGKNVVSYPDGATVDRQGSAASNSNVVEYAYEKSSGTVTTPEGSTIKVGSDGTIAVPEGSTIAGVEYPYGATILPDGIIVANLAPFVVLPDFTFDSDTAGTGDGDDTTTIDDEAIPLAGLISRAQLVSYLYAHEGSLDGEDAEGEYTLAWAWAVENAIEEEKNDPEEIVTVAILREVMTNYAAYLDNTFDVEIEGEDDVPVMNCDEILAEFYASLEDKAA